MLRNKIPYNASLFAYWRLVNQQISLKTRLLLHLGENIREKWFFHYGYLLWRFHDRRKKNVSSGLSSEDTADFFFIDNRKRPIVTAKFLISFLSVFVCLFWFFNMFLSVHIVARKVSCSRHKRIVLVHGLVNALQPWPPPQLLISHVIKKVNLVSMNKATKSPSRLTHTVLPGIARPQKPLSFFFSLSSSLFFAITPFLSQPCFRSTLIPIWP